MTMWGSVTGRRLCLGALALVVMGPCGAAAQSLPELQTYSPPRPPGLIPAPPGLERSLAPANAPVGAGPPVVIAPPMPPPPPSAVPPAATAVPQIPSGQAALALSARFGREPPLIGGGLVWRVYADRPDQSGTFRLVKEDKTASPTFVLPAGGYVVNVTFGLANATRRVQLRADTVREVFEIAAGGARFEGRVGDSRIPPGQIAFDIYPGSQFEPGERRPIARDVATGDVLLLPEGTYYVVSNYGDTNAVVRSDIRVQVGKLTDVTINHRAAVITLKLVNEAGGEALANTAWSVLTPGGDVIKESIGAFPKVILAEGEYVAIARNEGKIFNRNFKVDPGVDREIEVQAQ
jgi:hypothetical protein